MNVHKWMASSDFGLYGSENASLNWASPVGAAGSQNTPSAGPRRPLSSTTVPRDLSLGLTASSRGTLCSSTGPREQLPLGTALGPRNFSLCNTTGPNGPGLELPFSHGEAGSFSKGYAPSVVHNPHGAYHQVTASPVATRMGQARPPLATLDMNVMYDGGTKFKASPETERVRGCPCPVLHTYT
ncbi:hypothetical protein WDU94_000309 [Cyamophila willieti]